MRAVDKALRNATVHMQKSPEVLRFSLSDKRIANAACAITIVSSGEYRRSRDP
ncbi:hypothetical protein [Desulfosporosinus sp. BG]|uniref:hypothetical protein n=1 Tax=Desulfosporosinus sp. BG TaxID=1633135 RepID=UPI00085640A8|nr:hypothetical protein [Desulfosporosinus sp. BG]ODA42486.1 hypothetical protein DSBG_0626 [Desulfosporosinus sp. BG]